MKSKKSRLVGVVTVAAVGAYLAVLSWFAEPKPSAAETATPPPKYSIVFVVDSSNTMFPPYGPNYFDLAVDGIHWLMDNPLLLDGSVELGFVQFADLGIDTGFNTPGYIEGTHWLRPTRLDVQNDDVPRFIVQVEPTKHFTASLMELGIREATRLLDREVAEGQELFTEADASTQRHIILLTTGEYRLPPPCPPEGYTGIPLPDPNVYNCEYPSVSLADFCACRQASCLGADAFCDRACHIRYFAEEARANGIRLSTIRLGPDWGYTVNGVNCEEPDYPYGEDLDYCPMNEDGSAFDPSALPPVPDRDGLLKELANWGHVIGGKREPCDTDQPLGKNARINPFYGFGTGDSGYKPGTAEQITDTITGWLCDWAVEGLTEPELQSHPQNRDEDYYDPERTQPILLTSA